MAAGGINYLLRTVVYAGVLGAVGYGAWSVNETFREHEAALAEREEQIGALERTVFDQKERIAILNQANQALKVDRRVARLAVLGQVRSDAGAYTTQVSFQELSPKGTPLAPQRIFDLDGRRAYIDALVIKFEDAYVERGDLWRGASICLFQRLFSENQSPRDGFVLDPMGERPTPYAGEYDEEVDPDLWNRFWDYANDVELSRAAGVRAMHGEAPYIELRQGAGYLITLRASGGLTITPE